MATSYNPVDTALAAASGDVIGADTEESHFWRDVIDAPRAQGTGSGAETPMLFANDDSSRNVGSGNKGFERRRHQKKVKRLLICCIAVVVLVCLLVVLALGFAARRVNVRLAPNSPSPSHQGKPPSSMASPETTLSTSSKAKKVPAQSENKEISEHNVPSVPGNPDAKNLQSYYRVNLKNGSLALNVTRMVIIEGPPALTLREVTMPVFYAYVSPKVDSEAVILNSDPDVYIFDVAAGQPVTVLINSTLVVSTKDADVDKNDVQQMLLEVQEKYEKSAVTIFTMQVSFCFSVIFTICRTFHVPVLAFPAP